MELETPLESATDAFRIALANAVQLAITKAAIVELAERTAEAGTCARELQILIGPTKFDQSFIEQRFDCSLQQAKPS